MRSYWKFVRLEEIVKFLFFYCVIMCLFVQGVVSILSMWFTGIFQHNKVSLRVRDLEPSRFVNKLCWFWAKNLGKYASYSMELFYFSWSDPNYIFKNSLLHCDIRSNKRLPLYTDSRHEPPHFCFLFPLQTMLQSFSFFFLVFKILFPQKHWCLY